MIRVERLTIEQGGFQLRDIWLDVAQGEYAVLMGRTGCGKTTLLEAICGLRRSRAGTITIGNRDVTAMKPALRGIGYVPQDAALFSTMTVGQHLAFALKIRRTVRGDVVARVAELAELLGIAHLLDRMPGGLSGGERQRVALGRALSFRPAILLLDEPLSALDDETRQQLYDVLRRIRSQTGVTTLHVTHNREDAAQLADRVLVLRDGQVKPLAA
jgi:ABC-type sugar transport system ATPase subunit